MYSASDLKKGLKLEIDGAPWAIIDFQFSKPGKGQALYRCKLKNLVTGNTMDKTYRSVEKIGKPDLMEKSLVFSYNDGMNFVFIDETSYEQVELSPEILGSKQYFLSEDMKCDILFYNDTAIDIELPNFVDMTIGETEPGAKGDTATNTLKPAKLENGYEIQVQIFVNEGDVVRIDTRTGEYSERVSKG